MPLRCQRRLLRPSSIVPPRAVGAQAEALEGRVLLSYSTAAGGEFVVTSATDPNHVAPVVGMDAAGNAVVVWFNADSNPWSGSLVAQRFDRNGARVGGEQRLEAVTFKANTRYGIDCFDVAVDDDGDFVVAYLTTGLDAPAPDSRLEILARRYHADGTPSGQAFSVADPAPGLTHSSPSVSMRPDGAFVVTWTRYEPTEGGRFEGDVYAHAYDAAGVSRGPEFDVRVGMQGDPEDISPSVALDAGGDFVVAWTRYEGEGENVYARRFDLGGVAVGGEFRVNDDPAAFHQDPEVAAAPDGRFVVAFNWWGNELPYVPRVMARLYDADGSARGADRVVSEVGSYPFRGLDVGMNGSGEFVVTWANDTIEPDHAHRELIDARWFGADGTALTEAKELSNSAPGYRSRPAVAVNSAGDAFFVWTTDHGISSGATPFVSGRRFVNEAPPAAPAGIPPVNVEEDAPDTNIDLRDYFADPDNPDSELTYSIVGRPSLGPLAFARVGRATGIVDLGFRPDASGTTRIVVRATDPRGAAGDAEIVVTVAPVPDAPRLGVLLASPNPLDVGQTLRLTPANLTDPEGLAGVRVDFWRESNGVPGLQTDEAGGDTPLGSTAGTQLSVATDGLAGGRYVYWARPVGADGLVGAAVSAEHTLTGDAPGAPAIAGVFLSGDVGPTFLSALQAAGVGDGRNGYRVPGGAGQRAPVPWRGFSVVRIQFTEPVRIDRTTSLEVYGVNQHYPPASGRYLGYDPVTFTVSVALRLEPYAAATDRVVGVAKGGGPGAITDLAGNALDGDWANGADTYPSGDRMAGGDFNFRINVLTGDTDGNGRVNALDLANAKRRLNRTASDGVAGPGGYSVFADVSGDGRINATDLTAIKQCLNLSLPAGEPAVPAGAFSAAAFAATTSFFGRPARDESAVTQALLPA